VSSKDAGAPASEITIPYGRQLIEDDDVEAVTKVLRSGWLTQGPAVAEFESELCRVTEARYAVAFCNGTAALHAACAAADLGPGDRVGTSTLSFVASANCARYVGAEPVLLDIDPATLNLVPEDVPPGLDAIVVVHFAGLPVDLSKLGNRPRVVIEDAAHALGALTPDGPVGNCARSDMCCFSFHPVKAVTTGEGGAVTTNDSEFATNLRRFRNHGILPTPELGGWSYDVIELGWNYRLPDIQAALGVSQVKKLDRFVTSRGRLADRYRVLLEKMPIILPPGAPSGTRHAYHLFAIRVEDRRRIYDGLRAAGIGAQVHYVPIHQHQLYRHASDKGFPAADAAAASLISLPLFPALTDDEQDIVVDQLSRLVQQ
jgi:dTDP-4-amino-4,6-dideoxygalactose transaminase